MTRPDITLVISILARHMSAPTDTHWNLLLRVLKYLVCTHDYGLLYQRTEDPFIHGFCDAAYQSDPDSLHSQMDYMFFHGRNLIAWRSWKYRRTVLSSTEAEYIALTQGAREAVWVLSLLEELGISNRPLVLYEDNEGAHLLTKNPEFHERTKHIAKAMHYCREMVEAGKIQVLSCRTRFMLADFLTKPQMRPLYEEHRWYLMPFLAQLRNSPEA